MEAVTENLKKQLDARGPNQYNRRRKLTTTNVAFWRISDSVESACKKASKIDTPRMQEADALERIAPTVSIQLQQYSQQIPVLKGVDKPHCITSNVKKLHCHSYGICFEV
ncbi:hypothetical protein CVT25_005178 [Psilocybe cyanescens]|uniref:Uncharacterized protein n=1 Tax=Psilocybe cyanescens TaxID=93625 RepID=A0A409XBP7_PSICY|nr:hypothetical protein CVT25_005178 [Psilocybe cyanescens]